MFALKAIRWSGGWDEGAGRLVVNAGPLFERDYTGDIMIPVNKIFCIEVGEFREAVGSGSFFGASTLVFI